MLTIHHPSSSLASPLFPKGVGLPDNLASSSITYLPMHCLGLKRQKSVLKKMLCITLSFGTRLEAIKKWTVDSGRAWKIVKHKVIVRTFCCPVQNQVQNLVYNPVHGPVYSPVKSPGFVPTHSYARCTWTRLLQ